MTNGIVPHPEGVLEKRRTVHRLGGSAAAMISFLTLGMTTNSNAAFGFAASSSLDN